jgi:hypothetical protein
LKPLWLIAQLASSMLATFIPGAIRKASATVVAPERRIMSLVITNTAAGDLPTELSCRETLVTSCSSAGATAGRASNCSNSRSSRAASSSVGWTVAAAFGCPPTFGCIV